MTAKAKPRAARRSVTLVFVGPTLAADEVRARLPDAEVAPPAAMGDVLRAAGRRDVARIAIIDGYFERMAAVWHKRSSTGSRCGARRAWARCAPPSSRASG